jgi:membrane-associated phospholipid phosphatase
VSRNPLAEAGARRRDETDGQYMARWQIAAYEAILYSAVVGSAWFDLWLSRFMTETDSVVFDLLRVFEDMGDAKWFLVTASCWMLGCIVLIRLTEKPSQIALLRWLIRGQAWLIASVAISGILANVFKWIFGRARPSRLEDGLSADWTLLNRDWGFQSFPSGHTTTLFAAAFVFSVLLPRWRWAFIGLAVLGGLGRIAWGSHFLSDVIAGAMLGIFTAWWLKEYLGRREVGLEPYGS